MQKVRYLENPIEELCFVAQKMAFVSGPRQCGKTTMAKHLLEKRGVGCYYNWDELQFRKQWTKDPHLLLIKADSQTKIPLLIFDEIHKAKHWKRQLKGLYDSLSDPQDMIVTGSARLNVYRKGSDSLMGRYFHFRLHPFSLAELKDPQQFIAPSELASHIFTRSITLKNTTIEQFALLDRFGPFPEPLFAASSQRFNLWQRGRIEKIVREDLRDLSRLPELSRIEMLISLLPERAANILSIRSLAEDLEVAYTTVKRWLDYLRELYYCFEIKPYSKSLPRSLKKESKMYLWDWSEIQDPGARFENMVACHLLKYCDYLTDLGYGKFELRYLRNKEKKEIDFLITNNNHPWLPIEVKMQDGTPSPHWSAFLQHLSCPFGIQLTKTKNEFQIHQLDFSKILVMGAMEFLNYLK